MIRELKECEYVLFKNQIQEAFQKGFEEYFGKSEPVIPDADILESYTKEGAKAYVCVEDDEIVGGCIVVISPDGRNSLDILYATKQNKGIGYTLWKEMERLYPNAVSWETCTPIFDKRNLYFYTQKCGFEVVREVYDFPEDFIGDHNEGMYEFKKVIL